jgi:hypothetical protein
MQRNNQRFEVWQDALAEIGQRGNCAPLSFLDNAFQRALREAVSAQSTPRF